MITNCPLPAALTAISTSCQFNFGQIVRMAFQQRQASAPFADEAAIQTLSNWTTLKAASDATKVVVSPAFSGFTIPQSEPQKAGGNDNSTIKGLPELFGNGTVSPSGIYKGLAGALAAELDNLTQFSLPNSVGNTTLTMYMFNADGYLFYLDGFFGIPLYNYIVGTAGTEGLNSKNQTPFSFDLPADWDRLVKVTKPTFDPMTDI